jgi:hypothetical protein
MTEVRRQKRSNTPDTYLVLPNAEYRMPYGFQRSALSFENTE